MRIDLPCCGFKDCRHSFDGNCTKPSKQEKCEYWYLLQGEPNAEWRKKHYEMSYNQGFVDACKYYENLLEHKKGKWIHDNPNTFKCSKCDKYLDIGCGNMKMNFCPNCGSYNGGKQDELPEPYREG